MTEPSSSPPDKDDGSAAGVADLLLDFDVFAVTDEVDFFFAVLADSDNDLAVSAVEPGKISIAETSSYKEWCGPH